MSFGNDAGASGPQATLWKLAPWNFSPRWCLSSMWCGCAPARDPGGTCSTPPGIDRLDFLEQMGQEPLR